MDPDLDAPPRGPAEPSPAPQAAPPVAGESGLLPSDPPSQGTPFGRYLLVDELGHGAMGTVYLAYQPELRRYCAIKVLHEVHGERLVREGRAVARLGKHPNLVQVYDAGWVDGVAYVAMELARGRSLEQLLAEQGPLPERRVLEIGYKVALALHHAHRHGLVHRDMKPANVVLGQDGEPQVLDFGLALDTAELQSGRAGHMVGTPAYMPPEQVGGGAGAGSADARSDVYGLGATLYHLLAGEPPYSGNLQEVLMAVLTASPPRLRRLARVSRDTEAVIARAMEKDPRHRYQSALELADDLSRVLAGELPRARRLGPLGRALRRLQRHPALLTAGALLALFVTAGAIHLSLREREIDRLWRELSRQIAQSTAGEARALLAPAVPMLEEMRDYVLAGLMPLDEPLVLGRHLVLRFRPRQLDWICWMGADGTFVGATRRAGRVILNHSWQEQGTGWEVEYELLPDGRWRELGRIEHLFEPRVELGYTAALQADRPVWTEPYPWEAEASVGAGQEWGITCTVAVRREGIVQGALTADYLLSSLARYLAEMTTWPGARSFLLTEHGRIIARSVREPEQRDEGLLLAALAALPEPPAALDPRAGRAVVFTHHGERYAAAFEALRPAEGIRWATAVVAPVRALRGELEQASVWLARIGLVGLGVLVLGVLWVLVRERRRARLAVRRFGAD
ncbi:MAG: hypothetical protein KatS3mg102_2910 [Planctomycetota bacterium]|nr:MAG: hypothetical protein KatS3mg102_2910 [Planctomycetota bacterium]